MIEQRGWRYRQLDLAVRLGRPGHQHFGILSVGPRTEKKSMDLAASVIPSSQRSGIGQQAAGCREGQAGRTWGEIAMHDPELDLALGIVWEEEIEGLGRSFVQRGGEDDRHALGLQSLVRRGRLFGLGVAGPLDGLAELGHPHRSAGRDSPEGGIPGRILLGLDVMVQVARIEIGPGGVGGEVFQRLGPGDGEYVQAGDRVGVSRLEAQVGCLLQGGHLRAV